ncbi:MAG: hydrogenase iron-sulfur subunit [bacterium]|nr:hydrogenase iron-sulfur subunit [bacterium]
MRFPDEGVSIKDEGSKTEFSPKILSFLCNWCSYAGADLAGVSRFQYPTNTRVIRVMCSARVDPIMILEGFVQGLDGILVLGCHLGDCHYIHGNYFTIKRVKLTHKLLKQAGIHQDRLYLDWVSAAEGERYAKMIAWFIDEVRKLGPFGEVEGIDAEELKERAKVAQGAARSDKLRWLAGKEIDLCGEERIGIQGKNVYGEQVSKEDYDILMNENVLNEYTRSGIISLIRENPLSIKEIASKLKMCPAEVLQHISILEHAGVVFLTEEEGRTPRYIGV